MNKALLKGHFPFRQVELKRQISEALDLEELSRHFLLQGKWVHRYGLETLPKEMSIDLESREECLYENTSENDDLLLNISEKEREERTLLEQTPEDILELEEQCLELPPGIEAEEEGKSKVFVNELLDVLGNKFKEEGKSSLEKEIKASSAVSFDAPPPPPRTLRHLRRWLPNVEDDEHKAS